MSKWGFMVLGLLFVRAYAQDATVLLKKAAAAETAFREDQALSLYQQASRLQPR
jgi:hypothetical protein